MGKQVIVTSIVRNDEVFVKLDDVVRTFLFDLRNVDSDESTIEYIKRCVDGWESYDEEVLEDHNNRY